MIQDFQVVHSTSLDCQSFCYELATIHVHLFIAKIIQAFNERGALNLVRLLMIIPKSISYVGRNSLKAFIRDSEGNHDQEFLRKYTLLCTEVCDMSMPSMVKCPIISYVYNKRGHNVDKI